MKFLSSAFGACQLCWLLKNFKNLIQRNMCTHGHQLKTLTLTNTMDGKTTYLVKLAVVGDTGVGKSSVSDRFARDKFSEYAETTIGAAFLAAAVDRPEHKVKFQIWDTAGQERYRALAPLYYRNAHVVVIVYDITSQSSFRSAKNWRATVDSRLARKPIYVLVGNKSDLGGKRDVPEEDAKEFADNQDMVFAEVSAKTGEGMEQWYQWLTLNRQSRLIGHPAFAEGANTAEDTRHA